MNRAFLANEFRKARQGLLTPDCRQGRCNGCGVCQRLGVPVMDWSGRAYDASKEKGFASLADKLAAGDNQSYSIATQRSGMPMQGGETK